MSKYIKNIISDNKDKVFFKIKIFFLLNNSCNFLNKKNSFKLENKTICKIILQLL